MNVLIAGASGQVGQALQATSPAGAKIIAPSRAEFDIANADQVEAIVVASGPDIIFNAAAYTAVDKAEAFQDEAQKTNATAVGYLADICHIRNIHFVHVSTDYVFNGQLSRAYLPDDSPQPLSIYGRTKWEGEQAAGPAALVVRTAWVYSAMGHNFVRTMLRLMLERDEVKVVTDQIGSPTYALSLAQTLWSLAEHRASGMYHYTDSGVASWYDFAVAIQEEALAIGLLAKAIPITPITSSDYPTPAKRPAFCILDKAKTWDVIGHTAPHWRVNLRCMLNELKQRELFS
jgi:dTDP-4-dehydrorhamnose reductase